MLNLIHYPLEMLAKIKEFLRREGKKLLIIFIITFLYYLFVILTALRFNPAPITGPDGRIIPVVLNSLRGVIESTITFYLLIYAVMIPLLQKKNWLHFFLWITGIFLVKFALSYLFDYERVSYSYNVTVLNTRSSGQDHSLMKKLLVDHQFLFYTISYILSYILTLLICFIVSVAIEWNNRVKKQKELEQQKLDAELSAIKYQINPHFLFNSLNFIYSKTVPLSDEVSQAVLLLSDIMRYALGKEEDEQGLVDLEKELEHLKNVIEINQMRFNNRLSILYEENIDRPHTKIMPLILITLVENAFKHGDLLDQENPLTIKINVDYQHLHFYICNKKKAGTKELSTGIGLQNVKKRLQLMYEKSHEFHVKEDDTFYITELTIRFKP
ncbi:hypothetical protein COR50_00410 [Chitinophaga caeni]|uniref:Signal transduction histidine kinase internal region domain-containing protein n=2 Tax=Chitinophaga caeni TaxID=2029983 RepID=A0A291QPD2_9BACT|nr:hypothetical protein COR50_00410 [Chitinophaga caeni]